MGKKAKAMEERYTTLRSRYWATKNQLREKNSELNLAHKRINELERTITKLKHPSNGTVTNIKDAPSQRAKQVVVAAEPAKLRKVQLCSRGVNPKHSYLTYAQYHALKDRKVFRYLGSDTFLGMVSVEWLEVVTSDPGALLRMINLDLGVDLVYAKVVALSD